MSRLAGKVAVVTGASKGIGAAIAERLAGDGAAVVVNARTEAAAEGVVQRIRAKGGRAAAVAADLSTVTGVKKLMSQAAVPFGPANVLVNNAGLYEFRPLSEIDEAHYSRHSI